MRFGPMYRSMNILMLAALIVMVSWTFKVKHDSREAHARVIALEKQIKAQEIEIDLFRSDWSLLTSPARLEKSEERYGDQLGLSATQPSQLSDLENLPPIKSTDPIEEFVEQDFADVGDDKVITVPIPLARAAQ